MDAWAARADELAEGDLASASTPDGPAYTRAQLEELGHGEAPVWVVRWADGHEPAPLRDLSKREAEVLNWISQGESVNAVAARLDINRETVRSHLQRIYRKLGVSDRAAAVAVAWREGLVEPRGRYKGHDR
ncbi:MAG: helix-turn-helix domain-containing protein [Aquihabitans sp.]